MWHKLLVSLAIPQFIGMIGASWTIPSVPVWYHDLVKPALTPPSWVFGPVWFILYCSMGFAFFLVWMDEKNKEASRPARVLFLVHLFINLGWAFFFFDLRSPFLAFMDMIVLWAMIVIVMVLFWRFNRWTLALLLPYWLWVSFAAYLNFAIWKLN